MGISESECAGAVGALFFCRLNGLYKIRMDSIMKKELPDRRPGGADGKMKNRTFLQSVMCAVRGFACALRTEKNYRYYLVIALVFAAVNAAVGVDAVCYVFQAVTAMGVFSAECANTAMEHLCDRMTMREDEEIRLVKDIAAGAVFCWGIAFFAAEGFYIVKALL